jgi:lysine 2,3-aminomutase
MSKLASSYQEKISPYLKKKIALSQALQKQYFLSEQEKTSFLDESYFDEGKNATGIYGFERLYQDRAIILLQMECPAHCRFCFRKNRVHTPTREMTDEEIDQACQYLQLHPEISKIVITGGEPFLNTQKLFDVLDKIFSIGTIFDVRIGTRALLTMPEIFSQEVVKKLSSYNQMCLENPLQSKCLSLSVHFNHSEEFFLEVMQAIERIHSHKILIRNQAVLLKGINDTVDSIRNLQNICIRNQVLPYYLSHCDPIKGNEHFRTLVQSGLDIMKELAQETASNRFRYIVDMPVGKVVLEPSFKLNYVEIDHKRYVQIQTPYKAEDFLVITQKKVLPLLHTANEDGYIVGLYLDGQQ